MAGSGRGVTSSPWIRIATHECGTLKCGEQLARLLHVHLPVAGFHHQTRLPDFSDNAGQLQTMYVGGHGGRQTQATRTRKCSRASHVTKIKNLQGCHIFGVAPETSNTPNRFKTALGRRHHPGGRNWPGLARTGRALARCRTTPFISSPFPSKRTSCFHSLNLGLRIINQNGLVLARCPYRKSSTPPQQRNNRR